MTILYPLWNHIIWHGFIVNLTMLKLLQILDCYLICRKLNNVANTQAKLYGKFITESNGKFQTKTKNIIFSSLFFKESIVNLYSLVTSRLTHFKFWTIFYFIIRNCLRWNVWWYFLSILFNVLECFTFRTSFVAYLQMVCASLPALNSSSSQQELFWRILWCC